MSDRFDPFDTHVERFTEIITQYIRNEYGEPDALWVASIENARRREAEDDYVAATPISPPFWVRERFRHAGRAAPGSGQRQDGFVQARSCLKWYGISRNEIVGVKPMSFSQDQYVCWPYYAAATLAVVEKAYRSGPMKCMSCQTQLTPQTTRIFSKILVCAQCHALAEKAEREIVQRIEQAKHVARNWLEQHILQGGLLQGGDGHGAQAAERAGLPIRVPSSVPELQREEGAHDGGLPVREGEPPAS